MDDILGYDCDGNEIDEYRVLRAIFSNDIDIEKLEDADPRQYCAIIGDDGNAYAISVYDWHRRDLIRKKENIKDDEEIPVIVKTIDEMENYELAWTSYGDEFYYDLDRDKLRKQLNSILKKERAQEEAYAKKEIERLNNTSQTWFNDDNVIVYYKTRESRAQKEYTTIYGANLGKNALHIRYQALLVDKSNGNKYVLKKPLRFELGDNIPMTIFDLEELERTTGVDITPRRVGKTLKKSMKNTWH